MGNLPMPWSHPALPGATSVVPTAQLEKLLLLHDIRGKRRGVWNAPDLSGRSIIYLYLLFLHDLLCPDLNTGAENRCLSSCFFVPLCVCVCVFARVALQIAAWLAESLHLVEEGSKESS